jgi:ferredoxin
MQTPTAGDVSQSATELRSNTPTGHRKTRNQGSGMRVDVDRQKCTGLGMCEAEAPHLFEVAPDGSLMVLKSEVDATDLEAAEAAIAACPTEALRLLLGK